MTETTSLPAIDADPHVGSAQSPTAVPTVPSESASGANSSGFGIASLVLGIASIPTGLAIAAVAAIVLGFVARAKEPAARTMANWGIVLGIVGLFGGVILGMLGFLVFTPFALLGLGWFWI
ncbi:DUF4190 domain-containing protein [Salinibacterium sp. ZJ70]|uniref:DUF4190 domain-containing protein n=1 Tax=Salinibacterium sp. ZJ70 TaxID=2708084 RepID=UPI0014211C9E|nr:DUF4190 domain-containing protein [Salinibacterium sp. ZJ70]